VSVGPDVSRSSAAIRASRAASVRAEASASPVSRGCACFPSFPSVSSMDLAAWARAALGAFLDLATALNVASARASSLPPSPSRDDDRLTGSPVSGVAREPLRADGHPWPRMALGARVTRRLCSRGARPISPHRAGRVEPLAPLRVACRTCFRSLRAPGREDRT